MEIWEQEAIRRVLAGEREEYRALMERHFPTVLRMTFRITGNLEDAEEAAQEAFLLAYQKLPKFREQSGFGTWVYRIAMNCSLNLIKRRNRTLDSKAESLDAEPSSSKVAVSQHPTPEAVLLDAEAQRNRERAMNTLTPMERTAFVLRHLEEQPIDVIAAPSGLAETLRGKLSFELFRNCAASSHQCKEGKALLPRQRFSRRCDEAVYSRRSDYVPLERAS